MRCNFCEYPAVIFATIKYAKTNVSHSEIFV